jgi:hypothetical protein
MLVLLNLHFLRVENMNLKELQLMKKQIPKAQPTPLISEEYDKTPKLGMSEMEAQARIARLISKENGFAKSTKTSTKCKQTNKT